MLDLGLGRCTLNLRSLHRFSMFVCSSVLLDKNVLCSYVKCQHLVLAKEALIYSGKALKLLDLRV